MVLSALSILADIAGLCSWFTGIKHGNLSERILNELIQTNSNIEKLSEHIFYASSIEQVSDCTEKPKIRFEDKRIINELLTPIQNIFEEDILSTAVISTPEKLRIAFNKDPWEVLFSIRPIERLKRPSNPDVVPIIFMDGGHYYIGWQMKGALPSLLNFKYDPNCGIYTNPINSVGSRLSIENDKNESSSSNLVYYQKQVEVYLKEIIDNVKLFLTDQSLGVKYLRAFMIAVLVASFLALILKK